MKYEPRRKVLVCMSPFCAYASNICFNDLSYAMTLYRAVICGHHVMLVMAFLQPVSEVD